MKNTKHIAIWENFEFDSPYVEEIQRENIIKMTNVFNKPKKGDDVDLEIDNVYLEFNLDFEYKRSGIEGVRFSLLNVRINGEFVSFDGDSIDDIEIEDTDISYERYESEIGKFPLYINEVEIDMNNSLDPKDFKYIVHIGNFNNN